jgi:hypothetical protein
MARDYEASPVSDELGLRDVVLGLVGDLQALRSSKISTHDALARAAIAKQIFNGVRLYLQASKFLDAHAAVEHPALENGNAQAGSQT